MSESTAKLKVTVKLHQQPLTELPDLTPPKPAPLSAARLAVAVLVIVLAAYGGRWLYQQWPHNAIDYAAYAAPDDEPELESALNAAAESSAVPQSRETNHTMPHGSANATQSVNTQSAIARSTGPQNASPQMAKPANLQSATASEHPQTLSAADGQNVPQANAKQSIASEQSSTPASIEQGMTVTDRQNIGQQNTDQQNTDQQKAVQQKAVQQNANDLGLPNGFRRIVLTAQMERLEPGTPVAEPVPFASVKRVYLFTEVEGFAGQHLRHRWYWNNQFQYEARLTVEDSPWRTYSEKWLLDDQRGTWRVEIVDQAQNVLYQHDFTYQ